MTVTPCQLAERFIGMREMPGQVHNPAIVAMLSLVDASIRDDETPWCSAFVHYVAWLLKLPRSNSLAARSWLEIGQPVALPDARKGFDLVVLSRGEEPQPPAHVLAAPGHVGFFSRLLLPASIEVLGGNQSGTVSLASFARARVLGIRRLEP